MTDSLLVAVGGFFGAISRYGIGLWANRRPSRLPWGTLTVNLIGSFLLGIIIGSHVGGVVPLLLGTGYMGAFTTFSTFKVESIQLGRQKGWGALVAYLAVSYSVGLLLGFAGFWLGQSVA
jgi:CrcB protein